MANFWETPDTNDTLKTKNSFPMNNKTEFEDPWETLYNKKPTEEEKRIDQLKKEQEKYKKQNEIKVNEDEEDSGDASVYDMAKYIITEDIPTAFKSGEIFKAVPAGAEAAINQTASAISSGLNFIEDKLDIGKKGELTFGQGALNYVRDMDFVKDDFETVTGNVVSVISQFATGLILTKKITGLGTTRLKGWKGNLLASGITEGIVYDPVDDNFTKMTQGVPIVDYIFPDYLATDMADSELKARLKNSMEGVIAGGLFDGLTKGTGMLYHSARRKKNADKARTEIALEGKVKQETEIEGLRIEDDLEKTINLPDPTKKEISEHADKQIKKNKKFDIKTARANTKDQEIAQAEEAKRVANTETNAQLGIRMLKEFEESTGKQVTTRSKKAVSKNNPMGITGKDPALYRQYREEILEANGADIRSRAEIQDLGDALYLRKDEELITPFMRDEYLDKVIAVAADLRDKAIIAGKKDPFSKGKVIDNLFDLTVDKQLIPADELLSTLSRFGMSFEDFMLVVVGQGSDYGRGLQKFSQLKGKVNLKSLREQNQAQDALEQAGKIRQSIMRIENLRRGSMVSSIATASRNLTSAGLRMPLEALGNIMDSAIEDAVTGGIGKGLKTLTSKRNFIDSTAPTKYLFRNSIAMKQYADFLFEQPNMENFSNKLLGQLNEIRRKTGRQEEGNISKLEFTLQKAEDFVDVINIPNRLQEFAVRRATFLGNLESLVRRNWDIDLFDAINKGDIGKLLKDSPDYKPTNAKSIMELMDEASRKALDVTYAKQPDVKLFRDMTQFITENGFTVIMPFPRFMFNSIELMAQYAAGASVPLTKALMHTIRKKSGGGKILSEKGKDITEDLLTLDPKSYKNLTIKDREKISRNVLGLMTAWSVMQWRMSDDAPADYKKLPSETLGIDGGEIDTTPQFPLRQYLWIGEAAKRYANGTFGEWFTMKEAAETFAGTNIRTGVGHSLIEDVADLFSGDTDLLQQERVAKTIGKGLGQYISSWAIPLAQAIETQRAFGGRTLAYKDMAEDPELGGDDNIIVDLGIVDVPISKKELVRPLRQRGFVSPKTEEEAPFRGGIFKEGESRERVAPFARLLGGINITEKDSEEGEYLKSYGFTEWKLGSRSRVPSIRRMEDNMVQNALPSIVDTAKMVEDNYKKDYKSRDKNYKDKYSEADHVNIHVKEYVTKAVNEIRSKVNDTKFMNAERPAYQKLQYDYRKLSNYQRSYASQLFFEINKEEADASRLDHIRALVSIGSKVKMN